MQKRLLFFAFSLILSVAQAQTGVSGGFTVLKGFGVPKAYPGIHIGVEIPRDDEVSYFGRLTATFANTVSDSIQAEAIDPSTTFPTVDYKRVDVGMKYINLEGGTRYYLGNGYDYGWSAYGGSLLMLSICPVRMKPTEEFDETKYAFVSTSTGKPLTERGSVVSLSFGLNAGVKNHFAFGMLYFDVSLAYALFAIPSNSLASEKSNFTPLLFGFNFGFRKDLY